MKNICQVIAIAAFIVVTGTSVAQRATIALLPFQNKAGIDTRVSSALVDMATTAISQTQKFELVERASLESVAEELNLSASGMVDASTAAQWGKLKGADYLVIGIVTEAGQSDGGVGLGRLKFNPNSIALAVDVRFVDSSTGSVVFADTFRREKKRLSVSVGGLGFDPQSEHGGEMARAVIDSLTTKIMLSVYPPKIIKVDDGSNEITLNYGDVIFETGQVWDVMTQGEVVIDPDTGESLGHEETKIGQIRITSTMDKLSKATIVSGAPQAGAICRQSETQESGKKKGPKSLFKRGKR